MQYELTKAQNELLRAYQYLGKSTDKDVADYMAVDVRDIIGRIHELVKLGVLVQCGEEFDENTHQLWRQCRVAQKARSIESRMQAYRGLYQQWGNCIRCTLAPNRKYVVMGKGNLNAPAMLIGVSPGRKEDELGLPYVGSTGKIMEHWVRRYGFSTDAQSGNLFVTNLVGCVNREFVGDQLLTVEPSKEIVQICRQRLQELLVLVNPRVVILVGDYVAEHFFFRPPKSFPVVKQGVHIFITRLFECYMPDNPDYHVHCQKGDIEWRRIHEVLEEALEKDDVPDITWQLPCQVRD